MKKFLKKQLAAFSGQNSKQKTRKCNLCKRNMKLASPFLRFCSRCKNENEVYLMSEWLPAGSLPSLSVFG